MLGQHETATFTWGVGGREREENDLSNWCVVYFKTTTRYLGLVLHITLYRSWCGLKKLGYQSSVESFHVFLFFHVCLFGFLAEFQVFIKSFCLLDLEALFKQLLTACLCYFAVWVALFLCFTLMESKNKEEEEEKVEKMHLALLGLIDEQVWWNDSEVAEQTLYTIAL